MSLGFVGQRSGLSCTSRCVDQRNAPHGRVDDRLLFFAEHSRIHFIWQWIQRRAGQGKVKFENRRAAALTCHGRTLWKTAPLLRIGAPSATMVVMPAHSCRRGLTRFSETEVKDMHQRWASTSSCGAWLSTRHLSNSIGHLFDIVKACDICQNFVLLVVVKVRGTSVDR